MLLLKEMKQFKFVFEFTEVLDIFFTNLADVICRLLLLLFLLGGGEGVGGVAGGGGL